MSPSREPVGVPLTVQAPLPETEFERQQAWVRSFDQPRRHDTTAWARDGVDVECVFCLRMSGQRRVTDDDGTWHLEPESEPVTPVVESWPEAQAFRPLSPVTPLHTLVVPRRHVPNHTYGPALASTMMRAAELARGFEWSGYDTNIIVSSGRAATQSVDHLHVHVVPRKPGDGLMVPWGTLSTEDPTAPHRCRQLIAAVAEQLEVREALGLADFAGLDDVRVELARLKRADNPWEDESRFEYTVSRLLGMDSGDFDAYRERNGVGPSPDAAHGAIYERLRERLGTGES